MIRNNAHKYSVSAMCKVLHINRSTYYNNLVELPIEEDKLSPLIREIFLQNRSVYGTRKIEKELKKKGLRISRRRIGRIMKEQGLVSKYTIAQYEPQKTKTNNDNVANILDRNFDNQKELAVVVSDLTYVRVQQKWCYVCFLVDLFNREIIGYSSGPNKVAALVYKAFPA